MTFDAAASVLWNLLMFALTVAGYYFAFKWGWYKGHIAGFRTGVELGEDKGFVLAAGTPAAERIERAGAILVARGAMTQEEYEADMEKARKAKEIIDAASST